MSLFDKQYWVLKLLILARKWTIYGFVDEALERTIEDQKSWMAYTESENQ